MMENVCGSDQFKKWWKCTSYNATINTTDILIEQVRKFQNSYFEDTCERLLLIYKKYIV